MPSFQVRNPIQQCAAELADACDSIERGITRGMVVGFAVGVGFGAFLLALISAIASPY